MGDKGRSTSKRKDWKPTKEDAENFAREIVTRENKKVRKRPDSTANPNGDDIVKSLSHSLQLFALPRCDMSNTEEVRNRIVLYFQKCVDDNIKPSVADMALAFGIDRAALTEYKNGLLGKNPAVVALLKKAYAVLDAQMNYYMQNGKINPVAGIFLMKNHHGYTNEQEIVVKPANQLGEGKEQGEIEQRYLDSIAEDAPKLIDGNSDNI